ncbi:cytochrome P450 4C1-like [Centruroides sculpturatus]|uniref:cytochrome P450 4C1-like n=1 Tax=Centruroides sculpturatus TaxID=218467 RepID=UPI000C6DDB89|nr:cytochrome P450 4C1-like [Centruroides sculpturatus]
MHRILKILPEWIANPMYWFFPIFFTTKIGKNYKRDVEIIHRFDEMVFKRKKENFMKKMQQQHFLNKDARHEEEPKRIAKQRLIDSLLDLHVKQGLISEKDVIRDMESFIFAGYDTTSNVMSWTLYFLGRFHEIQEKVYLEFQEIFKNDMKRDITIDDLTKMTYLECVIKESMRIYSPGFLIARKNPSEMKISNYVLPANSTLIVNICGIHHNPSVYENPEVFDPDRFLPENYKNLHPYAFLAFSAGPRNCLANVLRNFKVYSLDPQDKIVTSVEVLLTPVSGIKMCVEQRQSAKGYDTTAHATSWTLYLLGRFHEIQEKLYTELQEIFKNDMNRDITIDDLTEMTYLECVIKGYDTTAHATSWTFYLLGRFHEIQEKLYSELQEIFKNDMNRDITIDDLTKMTYLECVIKESMRIYPPLPFIARKNPSEMKIGNYLLPANSTLVISIYGIHHNPSVYENPEVFDPDRFLPKNYKNLHPYAFLPFSAGPRNCLGSKLAMIKMKTVLANVLRNFKFYSLDPQDKIVTSYSVMFTSTLGIRMCVEKR